MSKDRRHLRVVPPPAPETPKQAVRRRLKRQPKPDEQIACPRCSSRALDRKVLAAMRRNGKARVTHEVLICTACSRPDELVIVADL